MKAIQMQAFKKVLEQVLKFFPALPRAEAITFINEFMVTHGDDAVVALAGWCEYAKENFEEGESRNHAIKSVLAHDLNGRMDTLLEPKSTAYKEFFKIENISVKA